MTRSLNNDQVEGVGVLYVVPTPIGNLGDMVPRAIEILQAVNVIAAEDTRHSAPLMQHFQIKTPLVAYHDHSGQVQIEALLNRLRQGEKVALISDAGTPLISDPGYRLVSLARQEGIDVIPVPGACAMVAALSASGLPSDRFSFEGFPPAKTGARQKFFQALVEDERTLIFYESPHRILASLEDMQSVFGDDRPAAFAREITKTFETYLYGSLKSIVEEVKADSNNQKGEMVVIIQGFAKPKVSEISAEERRVMEIMMDELPLKQASALTAKITGQKKNKLYQWALSEKQ